MPDLNPDSPDGPGPAVYCRVRSLEVSVWPDGHECIDSVTWCVTVAWRGRDRWAVMRGSGTSGPVLSRDGKWDYEPLPSSREDDWLEAHRFTQPEALRLAAKVAPSLRLNGLTALDAMEDCSGRECNR